MSRLQMPAKGKSAAMLAELQAAHAAGEEQGDEAHPEESAPATNVTTLQESNVTSQQATLRPEASPGRAAVAADSASGDWQRQERLALAQARGAEDQLTVVTIRVPMCLNRYMDEYVARRNLADPRVKYRKQDAIAAAFAAFYADHPLPPSAETGDL